MSYESRLATAILVAVLVPPVVFAYVEWSQPGSVQKLPTGEQAIARRLETLGVHHPAKTGSGFGAERSSGHLTIRRVMSGQYHIVSVELLVPMESPEYRRALLAQLTRCPALGQVVCPELSADGLREFKAALPNCHISTESPPLPQGNTTCKLSSASGVPHG